MLSKAVQSIKTFAPTEVNFAGNVMETSEVQPMKDSVPNDVNAEFKFTDESCVQPVNALLPRLVTLGKLTSVSEVQPIKHSYPTCVQAAKSTEVSEVQPAKTPFANFVIFSSPLTFVKLTQSRKVSAALDAEAAVADVPITFKLVGRVTSVKPLPMNVFLPR